MFSGMPYVSVACAPEPMLLSGCRPCPSVLPRRWQHLGTAVNPANYRPARLQRFAPSALLRVPSTLCPMTPQGACRRSRCAQHPCSSVRGPRHIKDNEPPVAMPRSPYALQQVHNAMGTLDPRPQ